MFINMETIPEVPADTTVLDLRFNKIQKIPIGTFPQLPHLNTLLLNNNEIQELEEGSFEGLPELRNLYLYKNKIQTIHPNTFRQIPHLEQLFLHNNELSKFPENLFDANTNLRRLRLDSNSLVCDCDMMWLADMLKEKSGYTQAAVICRYPSKFHGRSLMSIAKEDFHCEKPKIVMQPKDVDVTFGNTVYFSCRAEGDPNPEIIWSHNDNVINTNVEERYNILQNGTLMIESAQDSDKGVYECIARNAAGTVKTGKAELRYMGDQEIPKFMEVPNDITAVEGDDAELPCHAMGNPRPDITWTHNSDPISNNIRARKLDNGALVISNIRVSDAGQYECSASNSMKTISSSARIRVLVRPVILSAPADVSIVQGSTVDFACEARGDTQPVLTWTKDGELLRNTGRYQILKNGEMLRIHNVVASDQGTYTCKAENAAGSITASGRLRMVENAVPSFSQSSELVSATGGTDIKLICAAEGKPDPVYDWMRDGRVLQSRNRFIIHAGELSITNVQAHDAGRFDCVAENSLGKSTRSIFLQVQGTNTARIGDQFVSNAIPQATRQVNSAVNTTISQLFDPTRSHTVQDLLSAFRYPTPEALDLEQKKYLNRHLRLFSVMSVKVTAIIWMDMKHLTKS
uniref:Cell adhesion molecule-related/down-regulated by oncogenes n=1 Tax=Arion vulgaris TaxID=1028688 RepID=A0A0B7AY06_9EUPU